MKNVRIIILTALSLWLSGTGFTQNSDYGKVKSHRKNNIDFTLGGSGLLASINYGRIVAVKSNYFINLSAGIGIVPFSGGFTVPHQLTFNLGTGSSFLELGFGGSYWRGKSDASGFTETLSSYHVSPVIGWRKHFDNNLIFRAYINPLIHITGEYYINEYSFIPYLGLSLGYSF
jgi:hypothetical protein